LIPMKLIFTDDSQQNSPTRNGMGRPLAVGGFLIEDKYVRSAEDRLDALCKRVGFPQGEEFKWSPSRNMWMRENLVDEDRRTFFVEVVKVLTDYEIKALVMIADRKYATATWATNSELDVTIMFLERVGKYLRVESPGLVVADRPGGDRSQEDKFVVECLTELKQNNNFVQPESISLILTANSRLSRLLQSADLITSATLAYVAGESRYSPTIFELIKPLFRKDMGRVAGYGVKIHPDIKYVNLYHWLFGDEVFKKGNLGHLLPMEKHPYFNGPDQY
jgi:hypothetical protein